MHMKLTTITNITEIRRSPKKVFDAVVHHKQPTMIVRNSKAMAVILDTASYVALLKVAEDHERQQDERDLVAAIENSSGEFVGLDEFRKTVLKP